MVAKQADILNGKSTLILLLLRLLYPLPTNDWNVTIDGVSLDRIDRNTLRTRLIALPQDTFRLLDGSSYMAHVDPYQQSDPEDCQRALDIVGLWSLVEDRGGLDEPMKAEPLSQGQKPLFSVARAVLRAKTRTKQGATGGFLLLDEVTSNVDGATAAMIQQIIRKEFEDHTMTAVAHRMETLKVFDRLVVMENGRIKESSDHDARVQGEAILPKRRRTKKLAQLMLSCSASSLAFAP